MAELLFGLIAPVGLLHPMSTLLGLILRGARTRRQADVPASVKRGFALWCVLRVPALLLLGLDRRVLGHGS